MPVRRGRGPKPLKRRVATRAPRKTLVVFCEGERTEPEYLEALRREPEVRDVAAVDLHVETGHGGSVPITLVKLAVAAKKRAEGEEAEIDEFWCVFDVEWPKNHPKLKEAIQLARANGIHIAISNPCFELWLALHFADAASWLSNKDACQLRREHDRSADKGLDAAVYMPRRKEAARRARLLEKRHERNATPFPHDNPSSGMFHLLNSVEPANGPQPPIP